MRARRRWPCGWRAASWPPCRRGPALVLALLPLVFTGEAMLLGKLYGPADLYATADPWKSLGRPEAAGAPRNPILSDLAFANLPWRAAVRAVAGRGPPAALEPIRSRGQSAPRDRAGGRPASGDVARHLAAGAALLDVLLHVHALSRAAFGLPLLPGLRPRRAGGSDGRGRLGLLDVSAVLERLERRALDGDVSAAAARAAPSRARARAAARSG